ncbi:MAG: mannonate dehydratase, partial [Acidobacteriota bacterium]
MSFRWFGADDKVTLKHIRQIPGINDVVATLPDIPVGEVWPPSAIEARQEEVAAAGLRFSVVESVPVHEDIKLGRPTRDRLVDDYCQTLTHLGNAGIAVVCYNFMPIFDWMRTEVAMPMPDGATTMAYTDDVVKRTDLAQGVPALAAWVTGYDGATLAPLIAAYRALTAERMWENFAFFIERIAPAAASVGVKLGLHPDDPPWPIFDVPRIITDGAALERVIALSDSPANGITFCTGSLGASPENDLPAMIRRLGSRVHFAHCRNVRVTGERTFYESAHPSRFGDVDMRDVMRALRDVGFTG